MPAFSALYANSIKALKCFYRPDAKASGTSHTMRGDLQCSMIFFQPMDWKTAVRLHRSHKTIFNRFMEAQDYIASMFRIEYGVS